MEIRSWGWSFRLKIDSLKSAVSLVGAKVKRVRLQVLSDDEHGLSTGLFKT
jgi:hypothetical protein